MNLNDLTIGDAKQAIERGRAIEAALGGNVASPATATLGSDEGLNIVILDRNFVYVGIVTIAGDWLYITDAKNVRRWGTTQGLGELAIKGPQPKTALDMGGTIKAPIRAVIGLLRCEVDAWNWS